MPAFPVPRTPSQQWHSEFMHSQAWLARQSVLKKQGSPASGIPPS